MGDQEARDREVLERAVDTLSNAIFQAVIREQKKRKAQREPPSVGSPPPPSTGKQVMKARQV